jgi:hypothetical protein
MAPVARTSLAVLAHAMPVFPGRGVPGLSPRNPGAVTVDYPSTRQSLPVVV